MAILIDGRAVAKEINENTAERVARLANEGIIPGLAVILVGDDPASKIYTRMKDKKAKKLGIHSVLRSIQKMFVKKNFCMIFVNLMKTN